MNKSYLTKMQEKLLKEGIYYWDYYGVDILDFRQSPEQIWEKVYNEYKQELEFLTKNYTVLSTVGFGPEYTTEELKSMDTTLGMTIQGAVNYFCELNVLSKDNSPEAQERKNVLKSKIQEIKNSGFDLSPIMSLVQNKIQNASNEELLDTDKTLVDCIKAFDLDEKSNTNSQPKQENKTYSFNFASPNQSRTNTSTNQENAKSIDTKKSYIQRSLDNGFDYGNLFEDYDESFEYADLDTKVKMIRDAEINQCNEYMQNPEELSLNGFDYHNKEDIDFLNGVDCSGGMTVQSVANIISTLCYARKDKTANPAIIIGLQSKMKEIIASGYNVYQVMRCINNKAANQKDLITEDEKSVAKTLESCINAYESHSPYKKIFDMARELGELDEMKKNYQSSRDYDKANNIDDQMLECKEKIREALKDYDLKDLESVLKNKSNYLLEANTVHGKVAIQGTIDEAVYNGLQSVLGTTRQLARMQEKSGMEM